MTGQERSSSGVAGATGVAAAALLLLATLAFYVTSGEAAASGSSSSSPSTPTSVFQKLPACRVDVHSIGVGEQRRHDVAVALDNDVRELWLVVTTDDGGDTAEKVVHVPAANGWARVSLAGSLALVSIAVNGSRNLEGFMTGCLWSATPASP